MNKKRIIAVALVMGVLFGGSIAVSAAGENYIPFTFSTLESGEETVEGLNSIGRIQGKESEMAEPSVILDSTDLVILAKAANQLNTQFTMALADAVKGIGSDISIQDENNYSSIIETINGIEERQGGTFDTSNMTESGTIGQEDYEASLVIPLEKGYYPDGSQVTVNLTDNNKSYYHLGYIDGLAEITNSDIEYVYHHHTDDCLGTVTKTCTITKRFTTENHPVAWNSIWCGTCNANTYHDGMKITHSSCGQATDYQILNCSRHADNSNYYSTSTHTYTGTGYICGYNEGDIEKATIVIKK